ncbi:MAG: prephenate dehydrogenase [Chloroflexota bacterium]|nr:prephenate dehydrogenase [Chloroflexota bacterium]
MQIAFLGLGLIGGSVARAATVAGFATRIRAWTPGGTGPRAAAADGIEACTSAAAAIDGADLVVLAAPPLACLDLLDELGGPLRADLAPDAVIPDVASTKAVLVDRARNLGLRFVGGHPMAGRESSGYAALDADLFRDRPWVVVPAEPVDPEADARVAALAVACGGRPFLMTAGEHDLAVAAISHVPLVVAAALVEAMAGAGDWANAAALAAGGWASMTRLAGGDPAMAAGIVATNGPAIASRLRGVRAVLDSWLELIEDTPGAAQDGQGPREAPDRARARTAELRFADARRLNGARERGDAGRWD